MKSRTRAVVLTVVGILIGATVGLGALAVAALVVADMLGWRG